MQGEGSGAVCLALARRCGAVAAAYPLAHRAALCLPCLSCPSCLPCSDPLGYRSEAAQQQHMRSASFDAGRTGGVGWAAAAP